MRVFRSAGFLESAACRRVRAAMDAGQAEPAEILRDNMRREDAVRRAASIEIESAVVEDVERRIEGQRAEIEAFFDVTLSEREGAGFLRYAAGGFYKPHRDRGTASSWPGAARRQIAVVIFLNSSREARPDGEFAGGLLQLNLDGDSVDVVPEKGLLVAFPADILHQVTVVRDGTRDSIVDWFY